MALSETANEAKRVRNRERLRRLRADPAYREAERVRNREHEKKRQRDPELKRQYNKAYLASANGQRAVKAINARSYQLHADERRATRRAYGKTPEAQAKAAAYAREWRKRHPGRHRGDDPEWATVLLKGACSYCGGRAEEIDHITPRSQGGSNDWPNLTPACLPCNRSKKNRSLLIHLLRSR